MRGGHGVVAFLDDSIDSLIRLLPNIREGTEEGFHQGRVAIRRIREGLTVVRGGYDEKALGRIEARLREAARILGRVRDADVAQRLIQHVEARFPLGQPSLAALKVSVSTDQLNARRRAIKKLERIDLRVIPAELEEARHRFLWGSRRGNWRAAVREHIVQRAEAVRTAIEHTGGVYFPNRTHSARVSIKQLRYALDLAKATRTWRTPRAIRVLKRAQAVLGEMHDREVLIARLDSSGLTSTPADATALEQFLRAEIASLHAEYRASRPDILAVCTTCQRDAEPRSIVTSSLMLASLAVPSLLLLRNTRRRGSNAGHQVVLERRVRVPVP